MAEPRTSKSPMAGRRPGKWAGGGKYAPKRKFCSFCAGKVKCIDYKDTVMLSRFISDRGKIEPRRRTGTCNRHQHTLATAIKQARHVALLPFVPEHIYKQGQVAPLNLTPAVIQKAEVEAQIQPPAEISAQT